MSTQTSTHIAKPHKPTKNDINKNIPLCKYSCPTYPDGSIITSVRELSYFLRVMINDGSCENVKILQKATIDKMLTLYLTGDGLSQGLGWSKIDFLTLWGHSGGDFGIGTYMLMNRKEKIGVIVFQNCRLVDPWKLFVELLKIVKKSE